MRSCPDPRRQRRGSFHARIVSWAIAGRADGIRSREELFLASLGEGPAVHNGF
jgi:hypothetical protein